MGSPCRAQQFGPGGDLSSAPILADLKTWLGARLELISQKGDLAKAIRYVQQYREGLTRFVDDGRIELDTNTVERAIRPLTLTRKIVSSRAAKAGPNTGPCWRRSSPLQAQQHRTAGLHPGRHHQADQLPPAEPARRAPALGLRPDRHRRRGLIGPYRASARVLAAPLTLWLPFQLLWP
jgi:hypothetical protein